MTDVNSEKTPELTLDFGEAAAPQAPAVTETRALDPLGEAVRDPVAAAQPAKMEDSLSETERAKVKEFAQKIDITNSNLVLQYGAAAQHNISNFSEKALANVRTKDMGEVGDMIGDLVGELKGFNADTEQKRGIAKWFSNAKKQVSQLKTKYDKVEANVDKISGALESHQVQLLKDISMLDKMYEHNLIYFKELTMYILAGREKLNEIEATVLPEMRKKAETSGLPEDAQAANDMASMCNRFDKKLHDLELTRMISIQMAPQIRLVQGADSMMVEKIQSTLLNTIPLWKNQMVIALGLAHSQQAMNAQRQVANMTNEMLKKNAEALKTGTIETAREAERGIVDIETLEQTNRELITTLDEVVKIQVEGRQKRREAEGQLQRIEGELKQKLLELRNS